MYCKCNQRRIGPFIRGKFSKTIQIFLSDSNPDPGQKVPDPEHNIVACLDLPAFLQKHKPTGALSKNCSRMNLFIWSFFLATQGIVFQTPLPLHSSDRSVAEQKQLNLKQVVMDSSGAVQKNWKIENPRFPAKRIRITWQYKLGTNTMSFCKINTTTCPEFFLQFALRERSYFICRPSDSTVSEDAGIESNLGL